MTAITRLAYLMGAPLIFSANLAMAQTMGEYGSVTAHAAGVGASASTMRPPAVHLNPTASSGPAKTYEVSGQVREDDSAVGGREKDDDSAKGDEWEQVKE